MNTPQDAWDWYNAANTNLQRMLRLAVRHWGDESLKDASIWRDDRFKNLEAEDIEYETNRALEPLDDLGVLMLFSVFEATVRDHLESEITPMTGSLGHPILEYAATKALSAIKQGSFANQSSPHCSNKARLAQI